jgi:hypothetical protein
MKALVTIVSLLAISSTFAGVIEDAVQKVETERNARCLQTTRTIFSKCIGNPSTCFYNIKYKCVSPEKDFTLKVKVRETMTSTVVTGIVIKSAK